MSSALKPIAVSIAEITEYWRTAPMNRQRFEDNLRFFREYVEWQNDRGYDTRKTDAAIETIKERLK